jgi:hypothetical protein
MYAYTYNKVSITLKTLFVTYYNASVVVVNAAVAGLVPGLQMYLIMLLTFAS